VVVNVVRVEKKIYYLIRPPRKSFVFTYLHGVEWKHVARKPPFEGIWREVQALIFDVDFMAAHNATFDKSVLQTFCDLIDVEAPKKDFLCTMKLARNIWNIFPTKLFSLM
jgi:DNA polymerase-3 subunit epsilon